MTISKLYNNFFESEKAGGFTLIFCTLLSLLLANFVGESYSSFWHIQIRHHSIENWINDGLMTVFFLLIDWN